VEAVLDLPRQVSGDNPDAIAVYCDPNEAGTPDNATIRWLLDQGVTIEAMTAPLSILAGHVIYEPSGVYIPNAFGEFSCILPAFDGEGLVDLVAWSPRSGRIASRLGIVGLLGEGQAERAAANLAGVPLPIWRTPLDWLRAGRRGVVMVDRSCAAHLLGGLPVCAADASLARDLRGLRVPAPRVITGNVRMAA
jgi:hypothetical protein